MEPFMDLNFLPEITELSFRAVDLHNKRTTGDITVCDKKTIQAIVEIIKKSGSAGKAHLKPQAQHFILSLPRIGKKPYIIRIQAEEYLYGFLLFTKKNAYRTKKNDLWHHLCTLSEGRLVLTMKREEILELESMRA
jgi:hypothetical protein